MTATTKTSMHGPRPLPSQRHVAFTHPEATYVGRAAPTPAPAVTTRAHQRAASVSIMPPHLAAPARSTVQSPRLTRRSTSTCMPHRPRPGKPAGPRPIPPPGTRTRVVVDSDDEDEEEEEYGRRRVEMPEYLRMAPKKAGVGKKAKELWRRGFETVKSDVRDVILRM
ncbi:hypothetical protein PUNSTDRAFT_141166 [Punctularia strigosozonata HHB-11173 SS5]|uniref:uncharacterized protein n=1 Tax=Punctularia strigosozonata (strain HHB-11173) TaxID=741275 RepID=UPI0004416D28|nr:uncharacterized protein PUNSTDRAFT_141166 [Punctularia strigosozonata HHB-11173 SS5]EIN12469.1 hypothetical protein PUNSTDRAFT_141166 [Punctularia strigosozonata HHB-11173 SS5]